MEQVSEAQRAPVTPTSSAPELAGCYVYCVAPSGEEMLLGTLGIEERQVHTLAQGALCAVVHCGPARPFSSDERDVVASWVLAHHRVVVAAWQRWGAVLPMAFNTIIAPGPAEKSAETNLRDWLAKEQEGLLAKLKALAGKAEFGFQVFWDLAQVTERLTRELPEVRQLEEQCRSSSRGLAYMYRQKAAQRLKQEMEARASAEFQELYERLGRCVERLQVEKPKEAGEGLRMVVNLSCLVSVDRHRELEALAAQVNGREGHSVRLVGPLPPYNFCQ